MARHATINFTEDVLAAVDAFAEKNNVPRSVVVRDACLLYLDRQEATGGQLVRLSPENTETLRQLSSLFGQDHDRLLNAFLSEMLANMGQQLDSLRSGQRQPGGKSWE